MKKIIVRLLAAALLGLAWRAGTVKAETPAPVFLAQETQVVYPEKAVVVVQPVPDPAPVLHNRPFHAMLNNHGMGCWAHHSQFGCGSFHSEMRFIFGSCRAFFMEPCIPNPPHQNQGLLGSASGNCNHRP